MPADIDVTTEEALSEVVGPEVLRGISPSSKKDNQSITLGRMTIISIYLPPKGRYFRLRYLNSTWWASSTRSEQRKVLCGRLPRPGRLMEGPI
jgi:hypothetical protein